MGRLLNQIIKENDIKEIDPADYRELAKEIRVRLVRGISRTGGHLASNLGTVELTMALHLCLDFPTDKLVWDVGHQAYVHKLLTGRADVFDTLRSHGGISGFPKVKENPADTFDTGHSSTSISVALGLAKARDLRGEDEKVFAVIGDGALSGGMAYEALNNAAQMHSNIVVVLNDNKMSIARNVGAMSNYLGRIRTNEKYRDLKINVENALDKIPSVGQPLTKHIRNTKASLKNLLIPGMLFENMGLIYIGPVDGHNIDEMVTAFNTASRIHDQPVLVHVLTKKGKGYRPAEQHPDLFHGVSSFNLKTGATKSEESLTYTGVFSRWLADRGETEHNLVSVCAAMPDGTGVREFAEKFPARAFDVGIAEEHAVTFAAGLAAGGMRPVVSLYSTFLQRAYDQMLHDVCLSGQPVIFAVDRSGIVGRDGETHQGIFDISFLSTIPNMTILSPMDAEELESMLDYSLLKMSSPVAVRYPRGAVFDYSGKHEPLSFGKAEVIAGGNRATVLMLAVGDMVSTALDAAEFLREKRIESTVVNVRFVQPFDRELIRSLAKEHEVIVTLEDNVYSGGFSQKIAAYLEQNGIEGKAFVPICLPDTYIEHGSPEELYEEYRIDAASVAKKVRRAVN